MFDFGVLVLFGLGCILFPCSGNVNPPPGGTSLTFVNGSTAKIEWTYDGITDLLARVWVFKRNKNSKEEAVAKIIGSNPPEILNSSLPRVSVKTPATLILHNVTEIYNGAYKFNIGAIVGTGSSEVVVYIAVTPSVWINCSRVNTVNASDDFTCACKGEGGNPPSQVTWYKVNKAMATGVEEATLRLSSVTKNDNGNYTCEAKSHEEAKNETEIFLNVNYYPEGTRLKFSYVDKSVTITCDADAIPPPTYKILHNGTVIATGKTYIIHEITNSSVGNYTCCAENFLGRSCSLTRFLLVQRSISMTVALQTSALRTATPRKSETSNVTTHTKGKKTTVLSTRKKLNDCPTTSLTTDGSGKISGEYTSNKTTEWYVVVASLASGFLAGIIFSYIVSYSRRKFKSRKPNSIPTPPTSQAIDSTYQELDLKRMNKEDNYQSLRVNAARNDGVNDDESNYTELNKDRDVESKYQSLT